MGSPENVAGEFMWRPRRFSPGMGETTWQSAERGRCEGEIGFKKCAPRGGWGGWGGVNENVG